jgi:ABC-type lipoprotein export system ATPase subunit
MDLSQTEKTTVRRPEMTGTPLIQLADMTKTCHLESGDFTALNHVSLGSRENTFVAIMGKSGSGTTIIMTLKGIPCGLHKWGKTVICRPHDPKIIEFAHRAIRLGDGRIAGS